MPFKKLIISMLFLSFMTTAQASGNNQQGELHIAGSYSSDQLFGLRAGYRSPDTSQGLLPESVLSLIGNPKLYFEGAVNVWRDSNNANDKLTALTLSPVFQWRIAGQQRPLYLEAGIGIAALDDNSIGDRKLSIHFQFEDRIGLSWNYDTDSDARITLGYSHYSQADIDRPNDGLDFVSLAWNYPL